MKKFLDTHSIEETEKTFDVALGLVIDDLPLPEKRAWMALWGMVVMLTERVEELEAQIQEVQHE